MEPTIDPKGDVHMGTSAATGAATGTAIAPGVGTVIGAGVGLMGGVLSNILNRGNIEEGYDRQKEALQNSIQWRVADAKKAGIHPLYAIGAPSMNLSPMVMEDRIGPALSEAGQSVGNVIANSQTIHDKAMKFMEYQVLASQVGQNDAQAAYYRSLATKTMQDAQHSITPTGLGVQHEMGQAPNPPGQGMIDLKAAENISTKTGKPWSAAGQNPAYELRYVDKNLPMYVPLAQGDSLEETLSEMSFPTWAGLLQRNARIFGPGWLKDMINSRYFGMEPTGHYNPQAQRKGGDR